MKKITIKAILLAVFVTLYAVAAFSQTNKRIEFAKGKSSATVKGNTGNSGTYYAVRARGGQVLILDLSPTANVGIKVTTEGKDGDETLLREEKGGHYEIGLEESGDYTIFVGSTNHKPISFTLTVKVRKMRDI